MRGLKKFKNILRAVGISAALVAPTSAFAKPYPAGIIDLPGSITASNPIGPISAHPWQNVNVDGMRIRTGWADIETADGVYDWALIDDCLTLAGASGKFIGLSVVAGIKSPPWLMGGDTFTDGSTAINAATLTSPTANFVAGDVGKVIVCDKFPAGTTIISTTSTVATLSAVAIATKTGTEAFSILARNPGVEFRVLTSPDTGVMPVPWDPVVLAKWKRFVAAFGARYDGNTKLLYVPMGGFSQTSESYLASQTVDADYFNAKAVAAGYVATSTLSAGMVAWEAVTKDVIDTYMTAFPTTPPFITVARPFPASYGGVTALKEIVAWAVAKYPGRIGIMNCQLHATSAPGYYLNALIYANRLTQPTGFQMLCAETQDPVRLGGTLTQAVTAGYQLGGKFIEVYEPDVTGNTSTGAGAVNLSSRLRVLSGENALIGGFIVSGPKRVILRGLGPSLQPFGISGFLPNPTLELHGPGGAIIYNDGWKTDNAVAIQATGLAPKKDAESAIVTTLQSGAYTVILRDRNNIPGIGLVEIYDLDSNASAKLLNLSTRGFVDTGDNAMIGGFIIGPSGSGLAKILLMAKGPSLAAAGIQFPLQYPTLELHDANGAILLNNAGWKAAANQSEIAASGLAPTDDRESAILTILRAGAYTAIVRGNNNTTGIGLVEVYRLD